MDIITWRRSTLTTLVVLAFSGWFGSGWLIALAIVIAYLATGRGLAHWDTTAAWQRAELAWDGTYSEKNRAGYVRATFLCWLFAWPVTIVWLGIRTYAYRVVPAPLRRRTRDKASLP